MRSPPAGRDRKDVMTLSALSLLVAGNHGETGTKAAESGHPAIESPTLLNCHRAALELSSRRRVWAPAKRGPTMSTYILAIGGNAKLGIDTSIIDEEDDVQSEDFSFVQGDYRETPSAPSSPEVSGEIMLALAGTVH